VRRGIDATADVLLKLRKNLELLQTTPAFMRRIELLFVMRGKLLVTMPANHWTILA
jgi:hypothetical protein